MKEHPIIFSTPMVKAILEGRKTQTRRVVELRTKAYKNIKKYTGVNLLSTDEAIYQDGGGNWIGWSKDYPGLAEFTKEQYPNGEGFRCPHGQLGDHLWVRETHYCYGKWLKNGLTKSGKQKWTFSSVSKEVRYFDNPPDDVKRNSYRLIGWYKRPAIFMPRWASRITLEITDIRVQRIQNISEEDAIAEGIEFIGNYGKYHFTVHDPKLACWHNFISAKEAFKYLWDSINAKRGYSWEVNPWVWAITFKKV